MGVGGEGGSVRLKIPLFEINVLAQYPAAMTMTDAAGFSKGKWGFLRVYITDGSTHGTSSVEDGICALRKAQVH